MLFLISCQEPEPGKITTVEITLPTEPEKIIERQEGTENAPKKHEKLSEEEIILLTRSEFQLINLGTYKIKKAELNHHTAIFHYKNDTLKKLVIKNEDELIEYYYSYQRPFYKGSPFFIYDHYGDGRYYLQNRSKYFLDSQNNFHDRYGDERKRNGNDELFTMEQNAHNSLELESLYRKHPGLEQFIFSIYNANCESQEICKSHYEELESDHASTWTDTCRCGEEVTSYGEHDSYWGWWISEAPNGEEEIEDRTYDHTVSTKTYLLNGVPMFSLSQEDHTYEGEITSYSIFPEAIAKMK